MVYPDRTPPRPVRSGNHPVRRVLGGLIVVSLVGVGAYEIGRKGQDVKSIVQKFGDTPHDAGSQAVRPSGSPAAKASAVPTEKRSQAECVAALPNEYKIGQRIMIGVMADQIDAEAEVVSRYNVGGVFLLGDFSSAPDLQAIKESGRIPAIVASDEEGGEVQRLATVLGALPAAQDVASTQTPDQAQAMISAYGQKLKSDGVDMVLGPVADVAPASGEAALGNRLFSSDPAVVTQYTGSYISGWQNAGILPTLKHFPGMGSASANTDNAAAVTPPLSELESRDLVPYKDLNKDGVAVMVGNQKVPGLTGDSADTALPASLSPATYDLLRQTYGYANSLIVTDSMSAAAIPAPMSGSVVTALEAGADIALIGQTRDGDSWSTELDLVSQKMTAALADGSMTQASMDVAVTRIFDAKHVDACSIK